MPLFTSELSYSDDYPTIEPSLKLDFANARALDPRITFERASTATYVGRDGLIKTAGEDEPRFDHDPETGESLGLLIEEGRTNLYPHSYLISNWPVKNGTFTDNYAISPDGTQNATRVVATNTDPYFYYNMAQPAGTYTLSIWVKGVGSSVGKIAEIRLGGTPYKQFTIPSEWTRFSHTLTYANSFQSNIGFEIPDINAQSGDEVYVWGAQLEVGFFPTSYIPTSGASAARSPDKTKITGTNFSSWYNQSEGSYFFNAQTFKNVAGNIYYGESGNGAANRNIMYANTTNGNAILYYVENNNTPVNTLSAGYTFTTNTFVKIAYCYKQNDFGVFATGGLSNFDTSGNIHTANSFFIGTSFAQGEHLNGHIKQLAYYPKRLTNNQLQTLTQ